MKNSEPTLSEFIEGKQNLENKIEDLVYQFEKFYNINVGGIHKVDDPAVLMGQKDWNIEVIVEL